MPKMKVEIEYEQKRPKDATPERALAMKLAGVRVTEIAQLWSIKPARVYQLIAKARRNAAIVPPELQTHTTNLIK